jgi:GNAT superfamily N-acetyltransferase
MHIKIAETDAEIELASEVMQQLRTSFSRQDLIAAIKSQRRSGYQIAYAEVDRKPVCVAGFVVSSKLAWGKAMYVDDLVTAEAYRSRGAGSAMIEWLRTRARELGCQQLHLDSGVQRFGAHRFYLRHGFNISSHHFSIVDLGA